MTIEKHVFEPSRFFHWPDAIAKRLALRREYMMQRQGEQNLFDGGPPAGLQMVLGLMAPGKPNIAWRVRLAVALGWVPLLLLSALQSMLLRDGSLGSFLTDYAAH